MTAAVTELNSLFKSTDWNLNNFSTVDEILTAREGNLTTELYRLLKARLQVDPATAEQILPGPSRFALSSPSVSLQPNRSIVVKVSSKESVIDTLMIAIPDAVQALFQRAESNLSTGTEITAQYGLKLLRRIRTLVDEISPNNLQGVVHAFVDAEDGSTTIEWIRNRSRLGFVLDRENESSWFVVLPNGFSKSGYLYRDSGLTSLRGLLEEFIAAGE